MIERNVRRAAAARGLDEAVTWSFISEEEAEVFGPADWRLANPISEDMKVMRPSLLPGLISAARRNLDRGVASARLFEVGRRYLADAERPTATLLLAGREAPRSWQEGKAQRFDAFDAKAEVIALLEAAGAPVANLQVFPDAGPTWHPGRSATLRLGPKPSSRHLASFIHGSRSWSAPRNARSRRRFISMPFRRRGRAVMRVLITRRLRFSLLPAISPSSFRPR